MRFWWDTENDPIRKDAQRIVDAFNRPGSRPDDMVRMDCFNKEEADAIAAHVPEEYRSRVFYTWLTWKLS